MSDPERRDPSGRGAAPPGHRHPVTRVVLYLSLFLGLQLTVGIPALFIWAILTGVNPLLLARGTEGAAELTLFVYACLAPVVVPLTVVWARRLDGKEPAELGARLPAGGARAAARQSALAAAASAGLLGLWLAAAAGAARLAYGGLAEGFLDGAGPFRGAGGGAALLGVLLLAFLVQSGVEEWVFRGYVFRSLRDRWSWASAAGASSLAFAVLHGLNPSVDLAGLVNTFLLGLVLAAVAELTASLLAPIVLHGAWNFLMASVLSLPVSGARLFHLLELEVEGPRAVTGGAYGPEGSWLLTALLAPVVVLLAVRVDRRERPESPARYSP
ncbi:MAG TPA: CPBP family intramembrane glutamic endopeptidase [Thermoanaerobaculia bacterium]|nr:CPBP family intramembrane glutamic endopeptidase [Thermoanaerobaculia bacterium]